MGIGAPSTVTEDVVFDDDNLQQVFDAAPFARYYAQGQELGDGWRVVTLGLTMGNAGGYFSTSDTPTALFEEGRTLWLYRIGCDVTASGASGTGDFNRVVVTLDYPEETDVGSGTHYIPVLLANDVIEYSATGGVALGATPFTGFSMPRAIPLVDGTAVSIVGNRDAAASGDITLGVMMLVRAMPAGVPPTAL